MGNASTESGGRGESVLEMNRIAIAGHFGERVDVSVRYRSGQRSRVSNF